MFRVNKEKITIKKSLFIFLGTISLILGIIGLFLPVLPTTPFLLLTAWLYAKSSQRLYYWLLNNKYFGDYIRRYREGLGIPLKTKIIGVSSLWITILISIIFIISLITIKIFLLIIAIAVTYHILSKPTYKNKK